MQWWFHLYLMGTEMLKQDVWEAESRVLSYPHATLCAGASQPVVPLKPWYYMVTATVLRRPTAAGAVGLG